jgi:hypothetical protein
VSGYFARHETGRGHRTASRAPHDEDQDSQLIEEARDVIASLEDLREQRRAREAPPDLPPQPASEIRRARVRALRMAYESRGLVFNEAEALARLAEVERRGVIR